MNIINKNTKQFTENFTGNITSLGKYSDFAVLEDNIELWDNSDPDNPIFIYPFDHIKSLTTSGTYNYKDLNYDICIEIVKYSEAEIAIIEAAKLEALRIKKWIEIDGQVKNLLSKSDATGQPDFASSNIIDADDLAEVRTWRQQLRNVHSDYTDPFNTAITDLLNPDNVAIADEAVKSIFVKLF